MIVVSAFEITAAGPLAVTAMTDRIDYHAQHCCVQCIGPCCWEPLVVCIVVYATWAQGVYVYVFAVHVAAAGVSFGLCIDMIDACCHSCCVAQQNTTIQWALISCSRSQYMGLLICANIYDRPHAAGMIHLISNISSAAESTPVVHCVAAAAAGTNGCVCQCSGLVDAC